MRGGASLLRKEKEAHRGRSFMEYVPAEKGVKSLLQELLINDMQAVPVTLDNLYSGDDVVRGAIFYIGERLALILSRRGRKEACRLVSAKRHCLRLEKSISSQRMCRTGLHTVTIKGKMPRSIPKGRELPLKH